MKTMMLDVSATDSVVRAVLNKFVSRATFGKEKYGTDLDRTDLAAADWIVHAQEELMDGILYLEKLRQTIGTATATAAATAATAAAAAATKVDTHTPELNRV